MELSDVLVCVAKTKGVLGDALPFCLSPFPTLPKFLLFPLTDPHVPILHFSSSINGPQQVFPPKASTFVLSHSSRLDLPQGLSIPCLEDERCFLSASFSPAERGSNVPTPFPKPWFPHSICDMLPSVTQGAWGGLEGTTPLGVFSPPGLVWDPAAHLCWCDAVSCL